MISQTLCNLSLLALETALVASEYYVWFAYICLAINPIKSLSYAEIRLVISHLLLNFEITEVDDNQNWLDHPVYLVWERPPLKVFLTPMNPRVRGGT